MQLKESGLEFSRSHDQGVAWWVCPEGRKMPVYGSHTDTVVASPEEFGLTREIVESLFRNGEEEAVLAYLVDKGWTRARRYKNAWYVMVRSWDSGQEEMLQRVGLVPSIIDEMSTGRTIKRESLAKDLEDAYSEWTSL